MLAAETTPSTTGSTSGQSLAADVPIVEQRLASVVSSTNVRIVSLPSNTLVDIAGRQPQSEQDRLLSLVGTTGEMNIIDTSSPALTVGTDVTGQTCTSNCASGQYKIVFTGAELNPSAISAATDPNTNQPIVQFEFQGSAESAFATYTQNNIGNYLTITLDNKVIESAVIQSQITGSGEINGGNMTIANAENLAALLKYGALPVPLKVVTSFQPGTPVPTINVSCVTISTPLTVGSNGTPPADTTPTPSPSRSGTPQTPTATPTGSDSGGAQVAATPTATPGGNAGCAWSVTPAAEPATATPALTPTPMS